MKRLARSGWGGRGPLLVAVVAATLFVAVGALGSRPPSTPTAGLSPAVLRGLQLAGLLLAVGGGWFILQARLRISRRRNDPEPAWRALLGAAAIMTAVAVAWYSASRLGLGSIDAVGGMFGSFAIGGAGTEGVVGEIVARDITGVGTEEPGVASELLSSRALWLLALAVVGGLLWAWTRRADPEEDSADERRPFELALPRDRAIDALLQASAELRAEGPDETAADPISRAYAELLEALEGAGAPRRPHEAPHEHLERTLGALGVSPEPLHRLAALHVHAEFGGTPPDRCARTRAAAALEQSLRQLRESTS